MGLTKFNFHSANEDHPFLTRKEHLKFANYKIKQLTPEEMIVTFEEYKELERKNFLLQSEIKILNQKVMYHQFEIDHMEKRKDDLTDEERNQIK